MKVEDTISLSVILCVVFPWLMFAIFLKNMHLWWGLGMLFVQMFIIVSHAYWKWGSQRPPEARDCGVCNDGGDYSNKGGMPSGHVTTAAAFVTFAFLITRSKTLLILGVIYVSAMGWARIKNKCHYSHQVIVGTLCGITLACIWLWILEFFV